MSEDEEERVSEDEEEDEEEGVGHRGVRRHSRPSLRRRRRVWVTAVRDHAPRVAGDAAADLSANEAPLVAGSLSMCGDIPFRASSSSSDSKEPRGKQSRSGKAAAQKLTPPLPPPRL